MNSIFCLVISGTLAQQEFNLANFGFGNQPGMGVQMGGGQQGIQNIHVEFLL